MRGKRRRERRQACRRCSACRAAPRGRRRGCADGGRARGRRRGGARSGAMPRLAFSGFCGETSHHTSSRSSRFSASRLIWRWPSWAGLNEPPSSPTRRGAQAGPVPGARSGPHLAVAADDVFVGGELLGPDRARAAAGGWSRCRSRRPCRTRRHRRTGSRRCAARWRCRPRSRKRRAAAVVRGHDRVGVVRAVAVDVLDRAGDAIDHAHREDGVEIFGGPIRLGRGHGARDRARASPRRRGSRSRRRGGRRGSAADARPRRRGRPAGSRPRRTRRCAASWRSARCCAPSRDRRRDRHRRGRCLRDGR